MKTYQYNGFEYFYDRNIRQWTVYPINEDGSRIEFDSNEMPIEASYFFNKTQLFTFLNK